MWNKILRKRIEENNFTKLVYPGEQKKLKVSQAQNIIYNNNFNERIKDIFKSINIYNKSNKINKIDLTIRNKDNPF